MPILPFIHPPSPNLSVSTPRILKLVVARTPSYPEAEEGSGRKLCSDILVPRPLADAA